MAEDPSKYLDAEVLNRLSRLEMKARVIVEGFLAGMHRSPHRGFSVEFLSYRDYVPGDDIKHIDWKLYGRTDRLYVKEYIQETNLRAHILLDTSESMEYGSGEHSKLELGGFIAASLAYLLSRQQDGVGLTFFDKAVRTEMPATTGTGHLRQVLSALATAKPAEATSIEPVFHELAARFAPREMTIVISDLFDAPENVLKGLSYFRTRSHDVVVFHVWDKDELEFPFKRMTQFDGLEGHPFIRCDPLSLRKAYLEEVEQFNERIRKGCAHQFIDYTRIDTGQRLDVELTRFLAARMGTRLIRRAR